MRADYKVVLDANVLASYRVCNVFLKLAEPPRLFLPRWSNRILDEVNTVHSQRLRPPWPEHLIESWQREVRMAFPDACVDNFECLIDDLTNDPQDRHVLAAAIRSGSDLIVTFNLKDFPEKALSPWSIRARHPQDYLTDLYWMAPEIVVNKVNKIAQDSNQDLESVLLKLGKFVPNFSSLLIDKLDLSV